MNIAFFVSAHGFGHAARATAVMAYLLKFNPECGLEVFTRVPEWFFSDALASPLQYHSVTTDVGVVQKDPFTGDASATLDRLDKFLPFSKGQVRDLAAGLVTRGCRAVVCDISPLGIAVAKQAGVPSVLVENFTWDWIYAPYQVVQPGFKPHMETLSAWYSQVDVHVQTAPVCRPDTKATTLYPISRPPKTESAVTRKALGVSAGSPLVLLTTGGVSVRHRFLNALEGMSSVTFVVPHDVSRPSRRGNVIVLPQRSEFHHPDLVRAADLVVGKLGYSTLAEVGHAGKRFGYILRQDSIESEVLAEYAARHLTGRALSEKDFLSGRWIEVLDALLSDASPEKPAFPNDARLAAEIVLDVASGGASSSHRRPAKPFDPFNDRRSRDIRNRLSEAFVAAIAAKDPGGIEQAVADLKPLAGEEGYRHYIEDRRARYRRVLAQIEARGIGDVKRQAIAIWNAGLFFECHDHLEMVWSGAVGEDRKALQGLIQAAGVFVHRQLGRTRAADRLASRAVRLIEDHRGQLAFITNIEALIAALKQTGAEAPDLKGN